MPETLRSFPLNKKMTERRIASNLLWTPQGVIRHPLAVFGPDGRLLRIEPCAEPDRQPATEFHAGLLVLDFPTDYETTFAALLAGSAPLSEQLPHYVPAAPGCPVVLSGLDYDTLRLTPQSGIIAFFC